MIIDLASDALNWRTARFEMRPLEARDAPALLALFGDPAVAEFMDIDPLQDLEEVNGVIAWADERRANRIGARWGIHPLSGGGLIGTCGFNTLELDRGRRGEIAYDLTPARWGQGVMSELLPDLIDLGFRGLQLRRIEAFVTPGNDRSCRLLERHGFVREALLRDYGFWKGRFWDQLVFAKLSGD